MLKYQARAEETGQMRSLQHSIALVTKTKRMNEGIKQRRKWRRAWTHLLLDYSTKRMKVRRADLGLRLGSGALGHHNPRKRMLPVYRLRDSIWEAEESTVLLYDH